MTWNWQQKNWPQFSYARADFKALEEQFLHQSGILLGTENHLHTDDQQLLLIEMISDEAINTSEIEGEYLDRQSVQSSIRRNLGIALDNRRVPPAEQGISAMLITNYKTYENPLTHEDMFNWHKMLMKGRSDLENIGAYRTHKEPMQIVSGYTHKPKIHFEAPPSSAVSSEMTGFIGWFNRTSPGGDTPLAPLVRASIAHLYFESIHPFEDGNGRIGRALVEKSLSQSLKKPTLIALSLIIQKSRKKYYEMLEAYNKDLEVTGWLTYFAQTIIDAQIYTLKVIQFLIEKTKIYDKYRGQINSRQEKVINRMFHAGPEGFVGGLSAENYISITKTSRATATRDLQDLVKKQVLNKSGALKATRYYLNIKFS